MALSKSEGYLFLCFGRSYIDDCRDLYDTLRKHGDYRPLDVVVLPEDVLYAKSLNLFEHIIPYDVKADPKFGKCVTSFERYCLLPRLRFDSFLNYHYTLILDVDMLCAYSTNKVWEILKSQQQALTMLGAMDNPNWHWGYWGVVCNAIKMRCYETHGGLFFFNKDYESDIKQILIRAEYCFDHYDVIGMKRFYQGGRVDEPCFAYAFDRMNMKPLNFSNHSIMTFNLNANSDTIPTRKLTECGKYSNEHMADYIPFIHMFEKNKSPNFIKLKQKILNR